MKKEKVTFFLPTRKGSQRVINKNTRKFAQFEGGLLENKLIQLVKSDIIDEIILSTNDERSIHIAETIRKDYHKIIIDNRPNSLCLDTTNLQDLITYVPSITDAVHIVWGHTTTPIVDQYIYDDAIKTYLEKIELGYDSLISVVELRNFLLNSDAHIINNSTDIPWPRTQDLSPIYEINHAMFITNRNVYTSNKNRIGNKPFLYKMNKIQSIDVDWEEDFEIAEMIYNHVYNK